MLSRIEQHLLTLYPLNFNQIDKEIRMGFNFPVNPYLLIALVAIEIIVLKLKKYQFKPNGDPAIDYLTSKLNSHQNLTENDNSKSTSLIQRGSAIFAFCIAHPIVEEFIFRGILTPTLKRSFSHFNINQSFAPLVSSVAFGLMHPFPKKLATFYMGLAMEKMNENNNGSIMTSTSYHIKNNICVYGPVIALTILEYTILTMKYLHEKAVKYMNMLSTNDDIKSKILLGAIRGCIASLIILPNLVHINKIFPKLPNILSAQTQIGTTMLLGAVSGGLYGGFSFFSEKNKIYSQPNNQSIISSEEKCWRRTGFLPR